MNAHCATNIDALIKMDQAISGLYLFMSNFFC